MLAARGIPFVFATGYGEQGLPEGYRDRPTLRKPFQMSQSLDRALGKAEHRPLPTRGRARVLEHRH